MASTLDVTNNSIKKTQGEVLLQIDGVSKLFDEVRAVDDVTLNIKKGEIFALLGGSGSGKSTLLRMLAGFEKPSEGRIFLDGEDITDMPPHERPINMMFQSYALFPHMTVAQNIAFGLKQDKLPKAEIESRVQEMLKLVHMESYAKRKPNQLSGGQRQRVALARSLAKRPKLLLLDEPMGALDKKLRTQMQLEVVDILEAVDVTCVMVTHDQEEAMTMAGRISIMNEGWIAQTGTPTDIYESPNSRMVAEFIGSVNLFEGEIVEDKADHVIIESQGLSQKLFIDHGVSTNVDDKCVWLAVRPEKTRITREQPTGEYNWSSGVVEDIAYLGGISVYYIRLPNKQLIQTIMTNRERRSDPPTWEEAVFISWEATSGVVLRS
ncbi:polyamine ABC transporter ATP-binding protein [Shewanella fidelis]|uniref:Spermidine/putrescine import ATP-binding protein PotA n=1 Tax=Shewanella fidelis TaxID=173509 RepID=A0AAW8NNX9_9GAMM|nr:polyamine ABC transporter ATP-binding protein [Shewanella fidelis]MDR8524867.1 polyamine ABC transporter ATP-binding protein [Shewanella fidelis]MDW4810938.1 polyamine ABC transporter ATP-binding protein [Shewanella fidelis]MDW4815283.1 polyamine ABC transporter ATP-binding protein [Shewanella fidelis]MDW4819373.1 polyamine ABC transporter ATP-binding protein [Shewanella fidelis]MDW4822949.1 polyamine ABC transporter ATP-binding protein [Shewanella fidelis]